ncbi:MAG TPA: RluA family pseudouridine synthase [Bryobacteraceae bacterium]|nr:RluA family pseudouridine synthase [Bryobacteraceae bacterium]
MDPIVLTAPATAAGTRLDSFLHAALPEYSRARLQEWIRAGRVLLNSAATRPSHILHGNESIAVHPAPAAPLNATPEDIPLDILYENADVVAVNKPAGMVVHAGAGAHSGTLTNALVHRFSALSSVGGGLRPGIVHRIDRYTSGVLLVARNDAAHLNLARQFASRTVEKTYVALVHGRIAADTGRIAKSIARDPVHRTRMTARLAAGRTALTEYKVLRRFAKFTLLEVRIGTGRTHQIRVHLASLGHVIAGDKLYGAPAGPLPRFFLHAARIAFDSPSTGARIVVEAPLPAELERWLSGLGS